MTVEIRSEHPRGRALAPGLRARLRRMLAELGRAGQEVSVLLAGDRRLRALNRRWRGIDRPTDVLSFPAGDPPGRGARLGDLAVSLDTAARRARREGRGLRLEVERYLAHGLLHLAGHDHHEPGEAAAMAAAEARLLGADGLVGAAGAPARAAPRRPAGSPPPARRARGRR